MELTILVDNATLIDRYYVGEPAFSAFLEDGGSRILFDTGYSDVVARNAAALGIDLVAPLSIALSHGHNDHTGGLVALAEAGLLAGKTLIAHPDAFARRTDAGLDVGSPLSLDEVSRLADVSLSREPARLSSRLWFLGEVPRIFAFEEAGETALVECAGKTAPDRLLDDTALAYSGEDGLFVVTGCSHSGICNIVEYAKRVCGVDRVSGILGGFHLFKDGERVRQTIDYLNRQRLRALYPCHCVSLAVKCAMARTLPVKEVGVGSRIVLR